MTANFSSIPVLDFSLTNDQAHKPEFIDQLRHALINVGFLYLKNHTVPQEVIDDLIGYVPRLFDLPQEAKNKILMANSPHFLGYSKLCGEFTRGKADYREQFEFATPHQTRWRPGAPEYLRLWGPCQVCDHLPIRPTIRRSVRFLVARRTAFTRIPKYIGNLPCSRAATQLSLHQFARGSVRSPVGCTQQILRYR